MAFVHEQSCECMKGELDLFAVPPTQTSIEHGTWVEYHPLSTITDEAPIEFDVNGTGEEYLDFANSYLQVKAKIVKEDGTDIAAAGIVGPVNNFLHSLFSQVDVSLNGTQITSSTATYPYRAYIENLLSYGPAAKESQLTSALFYKDMGVRMDEANPHADNNNDGLHKRAGFTGGSRTVDMIGRIHSDIFFQDRYMLNEVNTRIRLVRSKDAFCLMAHGATPYKITIVDAVLFIRKVKISPSVFLAHAKTLEHGTAKYPIRRVVCKTFTVPTGNLDACHEKLFSGQLPTRIVIGCVDNAAFNGAVGRNPFNFKHFSLNEIAVYLDGHQQAIKPMQTNFAAGQFMYMGMFAGSGKLYRDEGNAISRSDFANGYVLYAFDLSPDLAEEGHFNLVKQGGVRLSLKFGTALPNTVTVVAYAEFENVIEIDRSRNVVFDFGS
jgi:hypothetical protein